MGSERVGWWVTFAVALFVGTMWALSVPPSGGPDEPAHMVKAAAVAGGDLSTSVQWHDEFPGKVPDTTVKVRTGYNYGSFWDQVTCWSGIRDQPTSCAPGLPPRTGRPMSTETYVGTYQPLYYGLVGLPTRFLPPDRGLYTARLISVAIVAALAASALASARSMGATTVAATLASFTPAVVFVASTVNPQGPELVASVTLWASGLLVLGSESPRRRELVRIGASATVLAAARPTGPVLVVTDLSGPGVSREAVSTLDPTRGAAKILFDNAPAQVLGAGGDGIAALRRVHNRSAVLMSFEQLGGSDRALEMARDYALERYAFGRQIGSYQAIKHKLADVFIRIEVARASSYYGAWALSTNAPELPVAAAAARIAGCNAYWQAAKENIQTHGGIGFTWEADPHLHYRRARHLGLAIGSAKAWKRKLTDLLEEQRTAAQAERQAA